MPFWSVVRSLPKREVFAAEQLGLRGYETFLPLIPTNRASAPLFAGYFFIRIIEQWRVVNRTLGVLGLIKVGDCPSKMPDVEIARLKALIDGHGFVRLPDKPPEAMRHVFRNGERVKIIGGPLAGLQAIHTGTTVKQRELILLGVLGSVRQVTIAAGLIVPAQ